MEKVSDSHHLIRRRQVWYYKRRVPAHAVAHVGKPFIQLSLKTTIKGEAKRLREVLGVQWTARFEALRQSGSVQSVDEKSDLPEPTEAQAIRLVQNYVEDTFRCFELRHRTDPPESLE